MAIQLTAADRQEHFGTWLQDALTNTRTAKLLGQDVAATRDRLTIEAIKLHTGSQPTPRAVKRYLCERAEPGTPLIWVCWKNEAIAVRTNPVSRVAGARYYLTWYWKNLSVKN